MMKLSNKDYELAQDFLNDILNRNEENISELAVTAMDLEKIRHLVQKKLSDLKSVIEGAEKLINSFEYEKYGDWEFISCLITLKSFDLIIMDSFNVWSNYNKIEIERIAELDELLNNMEKRRK